MHNGDRTFNGTTAVYYEANGRDLSVKLVKKVLFLIY